MRIKKYEAGISEAEKKPDNCADDDDEQGNLDREQRVYNYLTINPPRIVVTPVMTSPTPILQASPLWEVGRV